MQTEQKQIPLIVDLDGTFLKTDSLQELLVANLRKPLLLLRAVMILFFKGKSELKFFLSTNTELPIESWPVNSSVNNFVAQRATKSKVFLVTGANQLVADKIRDKYPVFDSAVGSTKELNLTSTNKANYLKKEFGPHGFDYIGNSADDIPIWEISRLKIYANSGSSSLSKFSKYSSVNSKAKFDEVLIDTAPSKMEIWLKELRIHQTLKNLLLFLPLIAAHQILDLNKILLLLIGFGLFSASAFSVYLLNDLLDLPSDRVHRTKYARPIAAGLILPIPALIVSIALLATSVVLAFVVMPNFGLIILLYIFVTMAYSFQLKKIAILDVVVLSLLYMIRILAGSVLGGIQLSFWFTGLTLFLFISLAIAKRSAELISHKDFNSKVSIPGRGYMAQDLGTLSSLGISSGLVSILFLAIYIYSSSAQNLYINPHLLWLAIPTYFYWIANLWLCVGRGVLHEDPVIFAIRNRSSQFSAVLVALIFLISTLNFDSLI